MSSEENRSYLFDRNVFKSPGLAWIKKPVCKGMDIQGPTVRVEDVEGLMTAVKEARSNTTIIIAPGTYFLKSTVVLEKEGLVLMGESEDRSKVVFVGDGFCGERQVPRDQAIMVQCARNITIANITIRECSTNGISVQAWTDPTPHGFRVFNCAFIDIGQRGVKVNGSQPTFDHIDNGIIENCYFEQTQPVPPDRKDGFEGEYIGGIDAHRTKDWIIRDNIFINIRGARGGGRGAIFVWYDSRGVIIERNLIIGCDRGIALGNPMVLQGVEEYWYLTGGIVRNNMICAPAGQMAMEIVKVRGTGIFNNSIYCDDPSFDRCVSIAHPTTTVRICNNLVHGTINCFEGSKAQMEGNVTEAPSDWFTDPANGNLLLTGEDNVSRGAGLFTEEVEDDFLRKKRNRPFNAGAHQIQAL